MKIGKLSNEYKTIVSIDFEDDTREKMQEKINELYRFNSPIQDFSSYYPFQIDQLEDWEDILDWKAVSSNKQVRWSDEMIRRFQDKWDWSLLWLNTSIICWDAELLEEFEDRITWGLIVSTSIIWTIELHDKFNKHLPSYYDFDMVKNYTSSNRESTSKNTGYDVSDTFMKLYSHAKSIDDEQGIWILFDAVEVFLNKKLNGLTN